MRPGELMSRDGTVISGVSPSGAPRADVYLGLSELHALQADAWPALSTLTVAMRAVGTKLAAAIEAEPALETRRRA